LPLIEIIKQMGRRFGRRLEFLLALFRNCDIFIMQRPPRARLYVARDVTVIAIIAILSGDYFARRLDDHQAKPRQGSG